MCASEGNLHFSKPRLSASRVSGALNEPIPVWGNQEQASTRMYQKVGLSLFRTSSTPSWPLLSGTDMHRAISTAVPESHTARVQQGRYCWVNTRSHRMALYVSCWGECVEANAPVPSACCPLLLFFAEVVLTVFYLWVKHCKVALQISGVVGV